MSTDEFFEFRLESTAFSCERLRIREVRGKEAISHLFTFEIDVVCLDHDGPSAESMTGAAATLVLERSAGKGNEGWSGVRRIRGKLAEVDDLFTLRSKQRVYRLHLLPQAFALTLVEFQDISMAKSIPQIIEMKLGAMELEEQSELRLTGTYAEREFVVQYKETDLSFVSRLSEHLGISFFFMQDEAHDTMVFTDHAAGFSTIEGAERLGFNEKGERRGIFSLEAKRRVIPGYYVVSDYNYRVPHIDLTSEYDLAKGFPGGVIEYGSHFKTPDEGKQLARVRAEERYARELVYTGESDIPALHAGGRFTLEHHPDLDAIELLVVEVEHRATQVVPGTGKEGFPTYENTFRAIPADRTFRPPRVTPKPRIAGMVTGIVDKGPGATGPYAKLDDQGRYTVRFLFDSAKPEGRPASRPVRMIQNHVGENYGTHFPLRPGIEVVLAFIDGDPDRPIIVGAVPNPLTPSPVTNASPGVHRIRTSTGITVDLVEDT